MYYRLDLKVFPSVVLLLCLVLIWCEVLSAHAEKTGKIRGRVVARESGQPLPSATVVLEGTKMGTSTGLQGEFEIPDVPPGTYRVIVRLLGYDVWEGVGVVVQDGEAKLLEVKLPESIIPLSEIQITAERARRQEDIRTSVLSVAPARTKTLAGAAEDIMRALQAYPGILSPNDFSAQMVIRGSGPEQNLIVMDDIEVFNPYRLYGLISMFNPETVSEFNLVTGGFPAKYGDRLSAVLDVTNREGTRSVPLKGSLNASISNANLVFEGALPLGVSGSYIVSARRTYYDLILGPLAKKAGLVKGDVAFPNFTDLQGKFVVEAGNGHKLVANMLFSHDGVDLMSGPERKPPDSVRALDNTHNNVLGLSWHYVPSKNFYSKLGVSWYRNSGDTQFGGDFIDPALNRVQYEGGGDTTGIRFFNVEFDSRYVFEKTSVKHEMAWVLPSHLIEGGTGVDLQTTSLIWHFRPDESFKAIILSRGFPLVENFIQSRDFIRLNLYLQDKVRIDDAITIQPGFRLDYFGILDMVYLQPRLNFSYAVDPLTTLRGAWGIYRQSPGYEKMLDQSQFYDLTTVNLRHVNAESATHYVLGVDHWLDNEWQLRVEAYFKKYDDVIVHQIRQGTVYLTEPINGGDIRTRSGWTTPVATLGDSITSIPVNGATGRSYGIEVLLEKRYRGPESRVSGWIGYSLAKAERIRDGILSPFRFQQIHTVDIVIDYRLASWLEFGLRWKYGTNFPYTEPIGLKPRVVSAKQGGQDVRVIQVDRDGKVIFDIDQGGEANRYRGQLPAYHRLDLRLTAFADWWDFDWSFYIDVMNVYNRSNVLNYRFYTTSDLTVGKNPVTMLPIFPTLGFSVRF